MSRALEDFAAELIDAWNSHDVGRIVACYAPDYCGIDVGESAPESGGQGVLDIARRRFMAFPDLRFTIEEVVVQDDRLAVAWIATGTHQGPLMRIPPTGRAVQVRGISLMTVRDGKVVRGFRMWDVAGMLRALRLLPEL